MTSPGGKVREAGSPASGDIESGAAGPAPGGPGAHQHSAGEDLSGLTREMLGLDEHGRVVGVRTQTEVVRAPVRTSTWWRIGFPAVSLVMALLVPVLVVVGSRVVLESNEGRIVERITDPAAPGFEAVVEPTPVGMLVMENDVGNLDGVVFMSLTGTGFGGVVQVPADTLAPIGAGGFITLHEFYRLAGLEGLVGAVERMFQVGIPDVEVVGPAEWAPLVAPVAPLAIDNPDPVSRPAAYGLPPVEIPRGEVQLSADEVYPYLSTRNPGEGDMNLLVRREILWRAWLAAVAVDPTAPGVLPGETDSGLGRFVRRLAGSQVQFSTLPAVPEAQPDGQVFYSPREAEVNALVAELVPLPSGPEGRRVRVRVLDGTGELEFGLGVAVLLGRVGAQVQLVGNAEQFGVATTTVRYYDEAFEPLARRMRDEMGVGTVERSPSLNAAVDLTVVLGADLAPARPDLVDPPISLGTGEGGTAGG